MPAESAAVYDSVSVSQDPSLITNWVTLSLTAAHQPELSVADDFQLSTSMLHCFKL